MVPKLWTRLGQQAQWRLSERLAFGNGRWHRWACPYCRGMRAYEATPEQLVITVIIGGTKL